MMSTQVISRKPIENNKGIVADLSRSDTGKITQEKGTIDPSSDGKNVIFLLSASNSYPKG
jgi:hypothetical protein